MAALIGLLEISALSTIDLVCSDEKLGLKSGGGEGEIDKGKGEVEVEGKWGKGKKGKDQGVIVHAD